MDGNMMLMMMMGIPKGQTLVDTTMFIAVCDYVELYTNKIELPENYTSDALNSSLHLYEILIKFF